MFSRISKLHRSRTTGLPVRVRRRPITHGAVRVGALFAWQRSFRLPRFSNVDLDRLFAGGWSVASVLIPEKRVHEGFLIASTSVVWKGIIKKLRSDWTAAYQIPPHVWEEVVAGAFKNYGFDEVILTPRSGDFGRDVIATRRGVGCIKIIGSVKAFSQAIL
jgi:hypothetical protein